MKLTIISTMIVVTNFLMLPLRAQEGFTYKYEAKNEYKEGLKNGKWRTFLDNNSNTIQDSNSAAYYSLAVYHGGKPTGKVRQFDMNDRLVYENIYNDGKLGEMRTYHVNGKLYLEIPYSDGKKNGLVKEYYESGILSSETPYTNGCENGLRKSYFGSGVLMSETPFLNGRKNGIVKNYNEDGSVKSAARFVNGKELTTGKSTRHVANHAQKRTTRKARAKSKHK